DLTLAVAVLPELPVDGLGEDGEGAGILGGGVRVVDREGHFGRAPCKTRARPAGRLEATYFVVFSRLSTGAACSGLPSLRSERVYGRSHEGRLPIPFASDYGARDGARRGARPGEHSRETRVV